MSRPASRLLAGLALALVLPACKIAPPGPFSLLSPGAGAVDVPRIPTFAWTKSARALSYSIQVAADPAFNFLAADHQGLTGTSWTSDVTLGAFGLYYWRVSASNPSGSATAIGSPQSFTTVPPVPGPFGLTSPASAATGVPLSPTFTWTLSSAAASYTLQVSTSPTFAGFVVDQAGIVGNSHSPAVLLSPTTVYYWRVTAVNSSGTTPGNGGPASFTTKAAAQISLSSGSLLFSGSSSGPNPPSQDVFLTNPSGASAILTWTVSSDRPWLQAAPASGTTTTETDTIAVSVMLNQGEAWTATTTTVGAPNGQENGSAVWTGKEMIVWGGHGPIGTMVNTGARYDPATDTWTGTTSLIGVPSARWGHSAVWTGTEMIIWGGAPAGGPPTSDGYRYDPVTDTWSAAISTLGAPSARRVHSAVWTGTRMIVWGGLTTGGATDTGAIYDPATDSWSPISSVNAPAPKDYHSAVWTGTEMIVFGGPDNTGRRYNPATDTWGASTSTVSAPSRNNACTVWTGSEMIVWSGYDGTTQPNTGARYDAANDAWQPMTTTNAPVGRRSGVAVWTGTEMIIWGGYDGSGFNNLGQRYVPSIALAPGSYSGTLTVTDPDAGNSPQVINVTFDVIP